MKAPDRSSLWAALVCAGAGAAVFQFFGNGNRGYIDTASLFYWWGFQWFNEGSETEHGPLVLGLAAWLFWRGLGKPECGSRIPEFGNRNFDTGNRNPTAMDRAAVGAMVGGLLLHALGFAAQQARISILALLLFAWGGLRLAGGRRWGGAAVFPLAFLVFAIPVSALDSVGFWLRVWVVDASAAIARAGGVAVLQSGTQLVAPDGAYNYDVAAACSGIRSLTALAALSLLAGYLNFRTAWRRGVGLLLCLPLVYVGNVARILAIIFAAEAGGPAWGDRAHDLMGYGIFAIVLGGVLGANALVGRFAPEPAAAAAENAADGPGRAATAPWRTAAAVAGLAGLTAAGLYGLTQAPPRGKAGVVLAADGANPAELPAFLGTEWIGRRAEISAVERELLPPDTGFSRKTYVAVADGRQQVFLSLVLSGRDRTSIHRPELCLVGQGWTVRDTATVALRRPGAAGGEMPATRLRVDREIATPQGRTRVPQLVVYWFVGGDRMVASHGGRMAVDAWQRVTQARADRWAYVLMQTDAADGEAAAMARLQTVIDGALPGILVPRK